LNHSNIASENYNPVIACAAACIGTAELFKYVMKPSNSRSCGNLAFSLLTYDTTLTAENPELPPTINVGEVTLVGAGAIGSAMVYSLRSLENVLGQIDVVDRDKYSVTNLNRYVIATELTIGKSKVETVKSILRKHSRLVVNAHDSLYNEFKANHPQIDTLITAVDKKITRFNIQSDLPRLIIDAATTGSQIDLARVDFGTEGACLGCVYLPDERDNQLLHFIAENIGLNYERVKYLYDSSEGINAEDVVIISKKIGKAIDHCLNEPIESVYAHEYCGSDKIESNGNVNETILAPLSFISALAGVMLACELIKDRYFPENRINNHFLIDTLKLPNPKLHSFKRKTPKCPYCNDPIYLDVYSKKWNR
jgi:molybdopterin/thiamine biosynthesis adenylyltransferase